MPEQPGSGSGPVEVDVKKMQERALAAAKQLQAKMAEDLDLRRLADTLLFSYRLSYWLISEICAHEGMTNTMAQWLIQAQDMAAKESFNFLKLMADMQKERLPWLESRRRETLARKKTLERRLKAMSTALRRKDIQLPFHSMTTLFGEDGFRHGDILLVFGPRAALEPVLRYCSKEYQRAGGRGVFLSDQRKEPFADPADAVISSLVCYGAADIMASFNELMEPLVRKALPKPVGLVVVESLDRLLPEKVAPIKRLNRLHQAFMTLRQYQAEHKHALIVGVATDDDGDASIESVYSAALKGVPYVKVLHQESAITGGDPSIVVGNDVVRLPEIQSKLKE